MENGDLEKYVIYFLFFWTADNCIYIAHEIIYISFNADDGYGKFVCWNLSHFANTEKSRLNIKLTIKFFNRDRAP